MMSKLSAVVLVVAGVFAHAGCGGLRSSSGVVERFVSHPEMASKVEPAPKDKAPAPTLEDAIGKVRRLMAEARPTPPENPARTLESTDPELVAALAIASAQPGTETYDTVATIYYQRRLLDRAYDYATRSLRLDPANPAAHDRVARIWRDWGAPQLALGDAHRAVFYAPRAAAYRNTLGTILQSLGQREAARRAYLAVLALDGKAPYAYNNLCYLSFLDGRTDRAINECQTALALDPQFTAAHNNLALVYAAGGRPDLTRHQFGQAAGPAAAAYNMGMVYLSMRRFDDAAGEFATAHAMNPGFVEAARRARYARERASAEVSTRKGD